MEPKSDAPVSRRRYEREKAARAEAERLLEAKSRELFLANQELSKYSASLEEAVLERTAELRDALEKAEAETAVRTRFIATMSHEIRTPLGGLLGMIDLLTIDETDPTKLDYLKNASTSGIALKRIVNDVLDFSKMESGVFIYENEAVDVRSIVDGVVALARANLAGADRSIKIEIEASVPPLFFGDATRIRQVISNLVSNAGRYSSKGPIIVRASAAPHSKGVQIRVEVEDFGVGIEDAQLGNLFKDFSQISNSLTAAAQGTGLGLAICKQIVEGCGGEIGVTSEIGQGSTFWFELPAEVLATPQATSSEPSQTKSMNSGVELEGRRVLLAEDNLINQKLLLTYLKRMGIDAELAENGRIALEKFSPGKFDLILMDVAMPEMDGLEATQRIHEKWSPHDVPPVVILTAHVMEAIKEDAARVGVKTVLCKPIPFDELRQSIEQVIAEHENLELTNQSGQSVPQDGRAPKCISLMSEDVGEDLLETFSVDDLENLVRDYVADAREKLSDLTELFGSGNHRAVIAKMHSLRGSSQLLGFARIAEAARSIEVEHSNLDASKLRELINLIGNQLDEIQNTL